MKYLLTFSLITFSLLIACKPNRQGDEKHNGLTEQELDKHLIDVNKIITDKESEYIDNYIKRYNYKMVKTGTGLRYMIYKKGNGISPMQRSKVKIAYVLKLLDGTIIYEYNSAQPLILEMAQAQSNNGLEEALYIMHEGDKAKIIIPSHLGYGLVGDGDKISRKAVLVYDLELLSVQN